MALLNYTLQMFLLLYCCSNISAKEIYVSPDGDNSLSGDSPGTAIQSVREALNRAEAQDIIQLLPGTYYQSTTVSNINGLPDKYITIRSYSSDRENFAVIDGSSEPAMGKSKFGFRFNNSSWIKIENVVFQNCWTNVIEIVNSSYFTIDNCTFYSGRHVIEPKDKDSHHVLVENCTWELPDEVWTTHSWEEMHHGSLAYYNNALLHPENTSGGHIMRNNYIKNVFNGFRTDFDTDKDEDGNIEVYGNTFINVRDNVFEPESNTWNIFFYHNKIHNAHKPFSLDDLKGGPVYIFNNVITQDSDSYTKSITTGIWKFKNGPLTNPCYAFNNSFYTKAKAFKEGEATNQQMKHFNNAYYFFEGSNRLRLTDWHSTFEFDYDCINQDWPSNITDNNQEHNGIVADAKFVDGPGGNLQLKDDSPCIDAGKVITIDELGWTQSYEGLAPDIGAYENGNYADGPAFRFKASPSGSINYREKPRIVKHSVTGNKLTLYFSERIDESSIIVDSIKLSNSNTELQLSGVEVLDKGYKMLVTAIDVIENDNLSIGFNTLPVGINGENFTAWGSTLHVMVHGFVTSLEENDTGNFIRPTLSMYPNPFNNLTRIVLMVPSSASVVQHNIIIINSIGQRIKQLSNYAYGSRAEFKLDSNSLSSGVYYALYKHYAGIASIKFVVLK